MPKSRIISKQGKYTMNLGASPFVNVLISKFEHLSLENYITNLHQILGTN